MKQAAPAGKKLHQAASPEAATQLQTSKGTASLLRKAGQLTWVTGWPQEIRGSPGREAGERKERGGAQANGHAPHQRCPSPRVCRETGRRREEGRKAEARSLGQSTLWA